MTKEQLDALTGEEQNAIIISLPMDVGDELCSFWINGHCERPCYEPHACKTCAAEVAERIANERVVNMTDEEIAEIEKILRESRDNATMWGVIALITWAFLVGLIIAMMFGGGFSI